MVFTTVTTQEAATQGYVVPARPEAPSPQLKVVCVYLLVTLDDEGGDDGGSDGGGSSSGSGGKDGNDGSTGGKADSDSVESRQLSAFAERVERMLCHSGWSFKGRGALGDWSVKGRGGSFPRGGLARPCLLTCLFISRCCWTLLLDLSLAVTSPAGLELFLEVDVLAPGRALTTGLQFARRALRAIDALTSSAAGNCASGEPLAEPPRQLPLLTGRAVSVSGHPACCPALDRVAERLASKLPRGSLRVVVEAREQLMGALPDEDPDAVQVRIAASKRIT